MAAGVETKTQPTGFGGVVGNKGGIAVTVKLWDSRLTFVSAHLAAHQHKWLTRNRNVREIFRGIRMANKEVDVHLQSDHTFFLVRCRLPATTSVSCR